MALNILFLILTNVVTTLSIKSGSLTFVIDSTASMQPDIASVISGSKSIVDVIVKSGSSQIQEMVLVTFNDPDVILRARTQDRNIFERELNRIKVYGGGDCPEMSLSGLELGLLKSRTGSYLFLFTDAVSKDATKERIERIKSLCQEKETHVVFVMTPNKICEPLDQKDLAPYYAIANSSSGQVLRLNQKIYVEQIISYINETVTGDRTVITSKVFPPNEWTNIPFEIDDQSEYAVASTSGKNVQFRLLNKNNVPINDYEPTVWIENVKVVKINKPGKYVARVYSHSVASVVIFARTDFTFEPGFSVTKVTSFEDTEKQPYEGFQTYLWVSVNEPKHLIDINSAEIFDMNENLLMTLPLKKIYSDVYVTDLFLPPDSMFKVAVNGIVRRTGKVIKRFTKVPVESIKSRSGAPKIIPHGGNSHHIVVVGDKVLRIPCVAIGNPIPSIWWLINEKKIEIGDDYSIENGTLIIKKIAEISTIKYTCRAENVHGKDERNHTVDITNTVDNNHPQTKYILKNKNEILKCPLAVSDTDSVRWFKNGHFISEGPTWEIIDASSLDDGNYTCRVSSNLGSKNGDTIEVIVDAPPSRSIYGKSHETIKWKGGNNVINCGIDIYKPTVQIQWLHNGNLMKDRNSLELYFSTWGNYTCKVSNSFGIVENNFLVTSEDCLIDMVSLSSINLPLILTTSLELPNFLTNDHFIIVPQGTPLKLLCDGFERFTEKKEINAVCSMEDQYIVNDKNHTFSDFYCNAKLRTQINESKETCDGENTKLIKIGYSANKFIKVIESCYDYHKKVPIYTKITITNPKYKKYDDDEITNNKYIYGASAYNATKNEHISEDPNCVYIKGSLTNAADISFGIAQRAIIEKQDLNDIFYLSCNDSSNWKQLEESISRFISANREDPGFTVWSGASKWELKKEISIPRYLWKVVKKLDSTDSLAIVTVNDPHYSESDRLCGVESQCDESWITELSAWPTYCCKLSEFSQTFEIPKNVFVN